MSFFTGWFESVVRADEKFKLMTTNYEKAAKSIIAAIEYLERKTRKDYQSVMFEKLFKELDMELYRCQMQICLEISEAFDKHFKRNRKKELNQ